MNIYEDTFQLTLENIHYLNTEKVAFPHISGIMLAEDLSSLVDSPSVDASFRGGYALRAALADSVPKVGFLALAFINLACTEYRQVFPLHS